MTGSKIQEAAANSARANASAALASAKAAGADATAAQANASASRDQATVAQAAISAAQATAAAARAEAAAAQERAELAQNTPPPAPASPPPAPAPATLPATGSPFPLIGLSGLFSLGAAGALAVPSGRGSVRHATRQAAYWRTRHRRSACSSAIPSEEAARASASPFFSDERSPWKDAGVFDVRIARKSD